MPNAESGYGAPYVGGMWESLARQWYKDSRAGVPILETKGHQVGVLYAPDGAVLKVVEPERMPFGFVG